VFVLFSLFDFGRFGFTFKIRLKFV